MLDSLPKVYKSFEIKDFEDFKKSTWIFLKSFAVFFKFGLFFTIFFKTIKFINRRLDKNL